MRQGSAASSPAAAAAAAAADASTDHQAAKRPRVSGPAAASTAQGGEAAAAGALGAAAPCRFSASAACTELDRAEYLQRDLELELQGAGEQRVGPEGVPFDELCERLEEIMDAALSTFEQQALPAGTIRRDGECVTGCCRWVVRACVLSAAVLTLLKLACCPLVRGANARAVDCGMAGCAGQSQDVWQPGLNMDGGAMEQCFG